MYFKRRFIILLIILFTPCFYCWNKLALIHLCIELNYNLLLDLAVTVNCIHQKLSLAILDISKLYGHIVDLEYPYYSGLSWTEFLSTLTFKKAFIVFTDFFKYIYNSWF